MKKLTLSLILIVFISCFSRASTFKGDMEPIVAQDFLKPMWHQSDAFINAGELGRYVCSPETIYELPKDVKIRPELITLLNRLQEEFNKPIIIMTGYLSQQQSVYLWARWLEDHPEYVKQLNDKQMKTWQEWVRASLRLPGVFQFVNKYQTGDAVDFYWQGLDFQTEKKRDLMADLVKEIGGSCNYSEEERRRYNIGKDDNSLLKVVGYMPNESISYFNPWGYCYFHVEYQPSDLPPEPDVTSMCRRLSSIEDAGFAYEEGETIFVSNGDYSYLAEVTDSSKPSELYVRAYIFCDKVRGSIGEFIPKSKILTRRKPPTDGWGTRKVMLEYYRDGDWFQSMDVTEYEDHYVVPLQDGREIKVSVGEVRFPIVRVH